MKKLWVDWSIEWPLMHDSNLSGVSIPKPERGMVNPPSDGGVGHNVVGDKMSKQPELSEDIPLWSGIAYIAQKLSYMPNHNLSEISEPDSDIASQDWEEDMDKVVNGGKVHAPNSGNALNGGKVDNGMEYDNTISDEKRGKVDARVGSFARWLHHNEPDAVDEHHHYTTGGGQLTLEQWADVHHPELREIWAIIRYRGDI